jgi:Family of unknown function (DUF6081)
MRVLSGQRIFFDDFSRGLRAADWSVRPVGEFPCGDGTVRSGPDGLTVEPTGAHPVTGEPAFAYATGPGGPNDHLKWTALVRRPGAHGIPGFAVGDGETLTVSAVLSVRTFGTADHPFGPDVAPADLRLAAGALIVVDLETGMIFDFLLTNSAIYAFYERLPRPGADHAAFSYAVPVLRRDSPEQVHELAVRYTPGTATWLADGTDMLTVRQIGRRCLPRDKLVLDHGGPERAALPRQLSMGLGLFALLDAAGPGGHGLVRLSAEQYVDPDRGEPAPQRFFDEQGMVENRLWGQGARLTVRQVSVYLDPP